MGDFENNGGSTTGFDGNTGSDDTGGGSSDDGTDPQQYPGAPYSDSSQGHIDHLPLPDTPSIPALSPGDANKPTSVDTLSLKKYADNLDTLADALKLAMTRVTNIRPIKCGTFDEATTLAEKVTGSSGLQTSYGESLHLLRQALMDSASQIRTLAGKYSTIDEINRQAGEELQHLIQGAQGDIQSLEQNLQSQGANA